MGQVASGKRDHLEVLIRRYASPLLTFMHRMVGDLHLAEELFQEVFLSVWLKRKQYKFPRTFRSWLFAIAANRCRASFRKANLEREPLEFHAEPSTAAGSPVETLLRTERAGQVTAAVAQLPPQQRAVVVMRIWNQMTFAQIAEALGRSEGTVRSHMHHGLAGVRNQLEKSFAPPHPN